MKIAYLSTFYPFRGGIAQFNASLFKAFEEKGHDIKAYTFKTQYPNFLYPGKSQYVTEQDNAEKIDSIEILNTINPFSYIKTAKCIKNFQPNIMIMKFWLPFFGPSLGFVSKKVGKNSKIISILDNVIPHEKRLFDKSFTKYFLKKNHGFIVMSETVKADLQKFIPDANFIYREHPLYDHFGTKHEKVSARKELGINADKKVILFFGLIRRYKGLDNLIKAFDLLNNDYELIIAGECYDDFNIYQELINQNNNKERIHLLNRYINDDEVSVLFSASDVSVLPYKSATQSGITSIAFHFELPVIATDVGGLKEIVQHEKYGLIVDNSEIIALKNTIEKYFTENLRVKFSDNLKQKKLECSWSKFAEKIIEFSNTLK